MKKLLLLFLPLLFVLSTVRGQTIQSTPATPHTLGTPTHTPSTYGSHLAFDKTNGILYQRLSGAWVRAKAIPTDGDKGSITVSSTGTVWSVDVGEGGIYEGSGTVPASTVATATNGFRMNSGASGQILLGDYGSAGLGGNLNLQGSGAILGTPGYQFRAQADDQYTQMVSPGYTVRLEPTTAYTLIQSGATNGYKFWDTRATPRGVEYTADYSATYSSRSLVDKAYVDAATAGGGDGNGIYDGSGTVPSGTVVTTPATGFAIRSIVPVDNFASAIRFDTVISPSTGLLGRVAGAVSISGNTSLAGDGGALVQIKPEDRVLQFGHISAGSSTYFSISGAGATYIDELATPLGLQYAADYSSTIAANDRSIPDVGTVKGLGFFLSSSGMSLGSAPAIRDNVNGFDGVLDCNDALSANQSYYLPNSTGTLLVSTAATATLNFPSTAAGTSSDLTITVTGAADGNPVSLGVPNGSTLANGSFSAWVSASSTVTIRFSNNSSGALDPAPGTFRATVLKY